MKGDREWFCCCGHTPCDGLNCGVYLPGEAPRKKPAPKTADEIAAIRAKAWATRRAKEAPALSCRAEGHDDKQA